MSTPPNDPQQPYDPTGQQPPATPPAPTPAGQPAQQPSGGQPPAQPPQGGYAVMSPGEERTWASAAHWSAPVAAWIALGVLGPLVILLVKGNDSPVVRRNAVESLNFQISLLIYGLVGGVVAVILTIVTLGLALLVIIPVGLVLIALAIILPIVAAIRVNGGGEYRYPLTLRLVS